MGKLNDEALENKAIQKLSKYVAQLLRPKPNLSGSEWADKYYQLSPESSASPGKWYSHPWQVEILDAMTNQKDQFVIVKKSTRIGYTKMLTITHAYFIHQRPSSQLHYQPNDDEARGFAEDELETMIRDNPEIRKLITTPNVRGRAKKEKTVKKIYPGGYLEVLGAQSDRNFNRRTVRVVVGDEVDTWKREAGKAGDAIKTMFRRTSDFWDRKNIIGGKPVGASYNPEIEYDNLDGISIVDYWFKQGTQEHRHLPCPHCGHYQKFLWEDLTWEKDYNDDGTIKKHYPETAHFVCKKCKGKIYDKHKRAMDEKGKWVADNPNAKIRSFHIWAFLSYSPNVTWADIVQEFLDAKKDKLKLKAFYSEVCAKTWEEDYTTVEANQFIARKEQYEAEVPEAVLLLTAGVDTQDDRLECEVVGWCDDEESYSIDYKIFHGDTQKKEVWQRLDEYLRKDFYHANGKMRIYATAIDTGGHSAKAVYDFCQKRFAQRVFAIKGATKIDAPIAPRRVSISKEHRGRVYIVGVNMAKDVIYSHITTEEVGAGYMHFPNKDIYNAEYFAQLTAERRDKTGRWVKKRDRNEALDCRVYAYVALHLAGIDLELLAKRGGIFIQQETTQKRSRVIGRIR